MEPRREDTAGMPEPEPGTAPGAAPEAAIEAAPEAAIEPAVAVAAVTVPTTVVGGSRVRWLVGGGLAAGAVALLVLAATLLGARPLPDALKYIPAGSAVVVELRPELPGDQRQHVGNFLAHFPGFEDQSTLDTKIDEALDRLVHDGTQGAVDYTTQVKPLLAGPMAIAVSADALGAMTTGGRPSGFLAVMTTAGDVTCDAIFGTTTAATTYRSVDIRAVGRDGACAVHDRFLLAGTVDSIRAGLDARLDSAGIDGNTTYRSAREKLDGDQVATAYIDAGAFTDVLRDLAGTLGQDVPEITGPAWAMEGLRVTDDALVLDAYGPPASGGSGPSGVPTTAPAASSRFASVLPTDTLGFLEVHGLGALVDRGLATLRADPAQAEVLQGLEAGLAAVGGIDNLTGWVEDIGLAVMPTGQGVGGALLLRGTDADAAAAHVTQIRNLLVLASTGTDITIRDADHNGVTITTVDLGDLSSLMGGLGVSGADTGSARVKFEMAARDDLVILGLGEGVVARILDVTAAGSVASTATYDRVVEIGGDRNDLQAYLAVDATLDFVEGFLSADELATFQREVQPYTDHLAGAVTTSTTSALGGHMRAVLTVK